MRVRRSSSDDNAQVFDLYKRVAEIPGGIARLGSEISKSYVRSFLSSAADRGIGLVGEDEAGLIVAELHAYTPGPFCFSHVLSDLTIVVDTDRQGKGWGRIVFNAFLQIVRNDLPEILRVELVARESNKNALKFYESLGFQREGLFAGRIMNLDGSLEADVPMAWTA